MRRDPLLAHLPTGLPNSDQQWFCPSNGATCYFYNATGGYYSHHRSACASMGGYIVAYNTGEVGQRHVGGAFCGT